MIDETDKRLINNIINKIDRLTDIVQNHLEEIETNYLYSDSIQFEFEKIFEDISRLSFKLLVYHPELPIDKLRGIRNRIAHDYEHVELEILIDTIKNNFPSFKNSLIVILKN